MNTLSRGESWIIGSPSWKYMGERGVGSTVVFEKKLQKQTHYNTQAPGGTIGLEREKRGWAGETL